MTATTEHGCQQHDFPRTIDPALLLRNADDCGADSSLGPRLVHAPDSWNSEIGGVWPDEDRGSGGGLIALLAGAFIGFVTGSGFTLAGLWVLS